MHFFIDQELPKKSKSLMQLVFFYEVSVEDMDLMGKYIKMNSQMLDLIKSFESDSKNQKDGYDQFKFFMFI